MALLSSNNVTFYLLYSFLLFFSPSKIIRHEDKDFVPFCSLMKPKHLTHSKNSTGTCFKYSPEYDFVNHFSRSSL